MKLTILGYATALSMLAVPAFAQSPLAAPDFAMKASVGNTFEVEESKLALQNASSAKVKAFATMMIADHTKAEKKLAAAAKPSGAKVEMKLDDTHQTLLMALQGKTGRRF